MMTAQKAAERDKSLSFEKLWAMFEEPNRKMAELEHIATVRYYK